MRCFSNVVVSLIIGLSMIITAKILASSFPSSANSSSDCITQAAATIADKIQDSNRYQMQIITEHGANWNGIYVLDKQTGRVRFYASSESF